MSNTSNEGHHKPQQSDATHSNGSVSHPVAQERITSEELAQAMSRIEARREVEAQRRSGTIPVGQGVEELDLAVTPEELLAEVRTLRRESRPAPPPKVLPPVGAPPAGIAQVPPGEDGASPLTHCPACARKLLTQASALCNWCGAKIDDPQYQERAARSRQTLDQTELSQLETLVQEEARYGVFGRLKRRAKQNPGSKSPLG